MRSLAARLVAAGVNGVRTNEILAQHSSWMIGGPADVLAEPGTAGQVGACVALAAEVGAPTLVIGHGTNILFSDTGLRGLVIKIGPAFAGVSILGPRVVAQAGAWMPGVAVLAMRAGLSGLEHAVGIPGTLGGLVVMNGGSRRQAIGSVVRRVGLIDQQGASVNLDQSACNFAYRSSVLQNGTYVLCSVELELTPAPLRSIRSECRDVLRSRRRKFPRKERSCGSVFLSTPSVFVEHGPPGRILEEAGLKGFRVGDAEVSSQHANFVLNRGCAKAADVLLVIRHMRETVLQRSGIALQCEVKHALEDGRVIAAHDAGR